MKAMGTASLSSLDTLVPPARLANLLVDARSAGGWSLEEMETRARGAFSIGDLRMFEAGAQAMSDDQLRELARLYRVDLSKVTPCRSRLEIDLTEGRLLIGDAKKTFKPELDDREVMIRYLALVYQLREMKPGALITPRDADLLVLGDAFSCDPSDVRDELVGLMRGATKEILAQHGRNRKRWIVPSIGVLVALTAAGGLLLTSQNPKTSTPRAPLAPAAVQTNIGTALTLERQPDGHIVVSDSAVNIGAPLVLQRTAGGIVTVSSPVNIGTALTIER